jgi:hypothetical protein
MSDEHDSWLASLLGGKLFDAVVSTITAPSPPPVATTCSAAPVRPSEMVSGASGVQYSTGENTYQADESGGDFADGSRKSAQSNTHTSGFDSYKDGSNPMQSPDLATKGQFTLRYGIGFLCSTYPASWNANLSDIADYSKPNSKFLKAFSGMNKTQQYTNPKKAEVVAGIQKWTAALAKDLGGCGQGELVVTFQGHGAHGSFFASDGNEFTSTWMLTLAKAAEKSRVSITFVMDACFAGGAVPGFQDHAAESIDRDITENVGGKGQVCSPENDANAGKLRDQMIHATELIEFSRTVAAHGDQLDSLIQDLQSNETIAAWDAAIAENKVIIQMLESEQVQFETNMHFADDPRFQLGAISQAFDDALATLKSISPGTCYSYDDWTDAIGKFEDQVGDGANRILSVVNEESK